MDKQSLIEIQNLEFSPKDLKKPIFKIPKLSFDQQKSHLILGPSGCGKSSFLKALVGLNKETHGQITSSSSIREQTAIIHQDLNLIENFNGLENALIELSHDTEINLFKKYCAEFGLEFKIKTLIKNLSHGERQRIAVARALAQKKELLLADEPTSHLDHHHAEKVIKTILEHSSTSIIVSHDRALSQLFDVVIDFMEYAV